MKISSLIIKTLFIFPSENMHEFFISFSWWCIKLKKKITSLLYNFFEIIIGLCGARKLTDAYVL